MGGGGGRAWRVRGADKEQKGGASIPTGISRQRERGRGEDGWLGGMPGSDAASLFLLLLARRKTKGRQNTPPPGAPIPSPPHLGVIIQVPEIQAAHPVHAGKERGMHWRPHDIVDIVGIVFKGVERLVVLQSKAEGKHEDFVALPLPRAVWRV